MANQELYDKQYQIPSDILKYINGVLISHSNSEGTKRAKFMLKNGQISYQAMKRLKNFFDYFNPQTDDKIQFALAGGNLMKAFIEQTLGSDRNAVKTSKEVKQDMSVDVNLGNKAFQAPELNEDKKYDINDYDSLKKHAIAVIVNDDNKILLLKRADVKDLWGSNQWALAGGTIEKNEEPEEACEREIKEETGLEINKFVEKVIIQRNPGSVEHIFACRYEGEPTDITLNEEHSNYGWFSVSEMEYLDTVPNLIDYINLVFKEY